MMMENSVMMLMLVMVSAMVTSSVSSESGGCQVSDHSRLQCLHSSLSLVIHSLQSYNNYSLSVISISQSNISFLPDSTFSRSSSVREVSQCILEIGSLTFPPLMKSKLKL